MLSYHTSCKRFIKLLYFGRWKTNSLRGFRCLSCIHVEGIYWSSCYRFFKYHTSVKVFVVLHPVLFNSPLILQTCMFLGNIPFSLKICFLSVDGHFLVHDDKSIASPQKYFILRFLSGCLHQTQHSRTTFENILLISVSYAQFGRNLFVWDQHILHQNLCWHRQKLGRSRYQYRRKIGWAC